MSGIGLGKLIEGTAFKDAVHVAVAPVTAAEDLLPGQWVHFSRSNPGKVSVRQVGDGLGIVDPFLKQPVKAGQQFYLWLIPGTITSLRHEWTHPAFKETAPFEEPPFVPGDPIAASTKFLKDFAASIGVEYLDLLNRTKHLFANGLGVDREDAYSKAELSDEFWNHFQVVAERTVPEDMRLPHFVFANDEDDDEYHCPC